MRLLHTADWHLGRALCGASFLEDQAHLLRGQFLDILRETRPDALLIAGDVFDRAVPPTEAVELLDEILRRCILDLGVPVVLIPGNHDATERLSFGASLLRGAGLHIADSALGQAIRFEDAHGEVWVLPSGYASPLLLARLFAGEAIADHDAGFGFLCRHLREQCPAGARMVMVAHAFVAGGEECESERLLAVGGAKAVAASRFEGFHYVALGHLHRPQGLAGGRIRYAGSPLAYSFSEAGQAKSVTLVEIDAAGAVRTEAIPLTPRRELRRLRGSFAELLAAPPSTDWLEVTLTDPLPIFEAQRRLAERHPHILGFGYGRHEGLDLMLAPAAHRPETAEPLTLLGEFWREMRGEALPEAALPVARAAIGLARDEG
ncbi:exonuclease SbcCD subunit D [Siccirubricoccus sp. G192]|uniref:exonuclease SbcCD subunit D n=1 Tax=Siccirubricoccus sp. G192 TaxID=2849651 RepID=UPI001C2B7831|nr:exonuclease SbcCD subunit D [Siccirubricoccus sp. G192]MBV1799814.1 exonuclease SbcCD subunit D [Siccirubricoccus sp. G192]